MTGRESFYEAMNQDLRSRVHADIPGKSQVLLRWAAQITHMLSGLNKLPSVEGTVYRGVRVDGQSASTKYMPGCCVRFSGVTSTSSSQTVAARAAGEGGSPLLGWLAVR